MVKGIYCPERIEDEPSLQATLSYVADQASHLAEIVLGRALSIDTVTVFAKSDQEYKIAEALMKRRGSVSSLSHGPTLYIDAVGEINGHRIELLGVRRPDPTRPERGYGDYPVPDLQAIASELANSQYAKLMKSGNGIELLELRHPDFDVRGYVVGAEHITK